MPLPPWHISCAVYAWILRPIKAAANPHNQAQSVSTNNGLSINNLVEPIGHQQSGHASLTIFASALILNCKKLKRKQWHRRNDLWWCQAPCLPPATPQESGWRLKTPKSLVVGEYFLRLLLSDLQKLNTKNLTLPFSYSFRCLGEFLSQTSGCSPL